MENKEQELNEPVISKEIIDERKKEKLFRHLEKNGGIISKEPLVIDTTKLQSIISSPSKENKIGVVIDKHNYNISMSDGIRLLAGTKCLTSDEIKSKAHESHSLKPYPIFNFPSNKSDLANGIESEPGHINQWDMPKNIAWPTKIVLEDGTETNFYEIYLSKKLHELNVSRDKSGELNFIDPDTNEKKKFSATQFFKHKGKSFEGEVDLKDGNKPRKVTFGSPLFAEKFLPNLLSQGVITNNDFYIQKNGDANDYYALNKRQLSGKSASYINIEGVRYYLGKEKIIGTNKKIDPTMNIVQLDQKKFGVVEEIPGRSNRLLYTFDTLNEAERSAGREQTRKKLELNGGSYTDSDVSANFTLGKNEMEKRVKEYNITEIFPQKNGEDSKAYAERIAHLGDVNYVLNNFRNFFIEAKIGVHNLPWDEQLQIANAVLEEKDSSRLISFASKYKLPGLRTFLSLETGGKDMGKKILTLSEKIPRGSVEILFKKYGDILNEVNNITDYLENSLDKIKSPEILSQIKEQLLIKGKNLIENFADNANKCSDFECVEIGQIIEKKLLDIKSSTILLASIVKTLVENNEFNLDEFKDIEISYDRSKLSSKNISDIYMMVEENTKQYPEKLREYWRGTAINGLQNPAPDEMLIYVKNKEDILSFMRVTPQPDGSFYGGSFNMNPLLQGSRIGTEFMKKVINQFTETGDFNAEVWSENPMLKNYIEKFGFEENGEIENYHDTGTTIKKITRRKQVNQN